MTFPVILQIRLFLCALALGAHSALAATVVIGEPSGDRWMYWVGDPAGNRDTASVYGAYGPFDYTDYGYDFDDRHAQFLLEFDTSLLAPPGQGVGNYTISAITLSVVVNLADSFFYDPTHDPLGSYLNPAQDSDLGRPLELFGVGYRNGWTLDTFRENSPYQSSNATGYKNVRNAFAMDFVDGVARDVSNNVEENFEVSPWAIGQVNGQLDDSGNFVPTPLAAGSAVPFESVVEFALDLSNPLVRNYLQEGLNAGRLQLMVTSLLEFSYSGYQNVAGGFPSFYTKENAYHQPENGFFLAAQLEADVSFASLSAHRPVVTVSQSTPSSIRVAFTSEAGSSYVVQSRDSLTEGSWSNVSASLNGTGSILEYLDVPPAGTRQRFYRVVSTRVP